MACVCAGGRKTFKKLEKEYVFQQVLVNGKDWMKTKNAEQKMVKERR